MLDCHLLSIFIVWIFVPVCGSLSCYHCSINSEKDKTCVEDVDKLVSSKMEMKGLVKNCSVSEGFCMIEKITTQYSFASYIRDCSDGHSFSYMQIDRLKDVPANNSSRCAYYNNHLVCVTLCQGDFCNGPQETSVAGESAIFINRYFIIFMWLCAIYIFS